jgi:hypothetical protein
VSALEALVGEWDIEVSMFGETGRGRMSCAWELGGAFLLQRSSAEHPDAPDGLCLIAPEADGGFTQHYFDSRGVVRRYAMTLDDRMWTLERDDVQRFLGGFEDGGDTIRGTWEWKRDGSWQKDFDLVYTRRVAP